MKKIMEQENKKLTAFNHNLALLLILLLFFSLTGCKSRTERANYILVTLDTQRADHLSCYEPENARTPNFDFLAQEGILYQNCYSLTPITLPSHGSIFYSRHPYQLRSYNNGHAIIKKRNRPSFVNLFRKNGYSTAAFVSLGVLKAEYGLDEGFGHYDDEFKEDEWYLTAEEINQKVFPWLEENKNQDFFLWVHYSDPHEPYYPPDSPPDLRVFLNGSLLGEYNLNKKTKWVQLDLEKGKNELKFELRDNFLNNSAPLRAQFNRLTLEEWGEDEGMDVEFGSGWIFRPEDESIFLKPEGFVSLINHSGPKKLIFSFNGNIILTEEIKRENYKKDVEYMDRKFGELLNELKRHGLMNKTHILVVGDHGEGLGDYINYSGEPHFGHIFFLYNVYMRVPLLLYNPYSDKKGIEVTAPVSLLDIAPTILEAMDFKRLPHLRGRSILGLHEKKNDSIFQETYKPQAIRNKFAVLQYPFHLIFTPDSDQYELYDLENDPWERNNLYEEKRKTDQILNMKTILDEKVRRIIRDKIEIQIDKDTERMLKSLGYIK